MTTRRTTTPRTTIKKPTKPPVLTIKEGVEPAKPVSRSVARRRTVQQKVMTVGDLKELLTLADDTNKLVFKHGDNEQFFAKDFVAIMAASEGDKFAIMITEETK